MSFKKFFKNVFGDFSDVHWKDLDHKKVYSVAAAILAVIILIIVLVVQGFSGKKPEKKNNAAANDKTVTDNKEPVDDNPLEIDAYQDVNDVVFKYFHGLSTGDIALVEDVVDVLTEDEIKTIETKKEYVEAYKHLICYTKKGLEEGSYVVFVSYEMKILNIETPAPGMMPLYVCKDDAGDYYIFNDNASEELESYVLELAAEPDIAEIINDIQNRYETALTEDADLAEFDKKIHESQQEPSEEPVEEPSEETPEEPTEPAEETLEEPAEETPEELSEPVKTTVTKNVRIRAGRSAETEMLETIAAGTGVKVYAHYSDGWSKIEYNGTVGYCKTEYLESKDGIPTISAGNGGEAPAEDDNDQTETPAAEATALNKKMRLKSTVRIRKERSADSDRIANGYQGEYVQAIESYSDGWCKVEYNGKTGYCQTQYLEDV